MGDWMARYLDTVGYEVDVADPVKAESPFRLVDDWESAIDDYDVVVVAVPLRPSNAVLHRLAELEPRGLVFDIGSLKSPMTSGLEALAAAGCRVCSVHPMFGPNEVGLSGRHILFVDVGNPAALDEARALFAHTAADCVDLSLAEHDEVMAWVLGLSHLVKSPSPALWRRAERRCRCCGRFPVPPSTPSCRSLRRWCPKIRTCTTRSSRATR